MMVSLHETMPTASAEPVYKDRVTTMLEYPWEGGRYTSRAKSLVELLYEYLKELGAPLAKPIEIRYVDEIGPYVTITLHCNASLALKYWIEILDKLQGYNIPIFIRWTGNVDVPPEVMGAYIGKALAKMNIFLATEKQFDIARILREEWKT